ncbi:MAG: DJ-1 family glyoxalase III [Verrucomicrobiota bacterium]
MMQSDTPSALVLLFDGVEEMEAIAPIDILRRAEVSVTTASLQPQETVAGRNGIKISPDTAIDRVDPQLFDLFVLPGGPGVLELAENQILLDLIKERSSSGLKNAAICAAPKVFAAAGLLDDRQATSHASVSEDIPNRSTNAVVVDGPVVTSQGAGTATQFALELAAILTNQKTANAVARSIHA